MTNPRKDWLAFRPNALSDGEAVVVETKPGVVQGWQHFVAGNIGGVCGLTISYPLDTVKIRLQTNPSQYRGVLHCVSSIAKQESVGGQS